MRFSAGKALSDSFAILTARFVPMAAIAAVFYLLPMGVLMYYIQRFFGVWEQQAEPDFEGLMASLGAVVGTLTLGYLVFALLRMLGGAAMTVAAGEERPATVSEALSQGLRALLPLIGASVLMMVAYVALFGVLFLVVGATMMPLLSGQAAPGGGSIAGVVLMFFALFVVIIYLALRLSLILPVIALGRERNPIEAIAGSWRMTRGRTFKIFLLFVLFAFGAGILNSVATGLTGGFSLEPLPLSGPIFWIQIGVSAVMDALFGIYLIALLVAIYNQLAGPSTDAVSETFA